MSTADQEQHRVYARKSYAKHREAILVRRKKRRAERKEELRKYQADYRAAFPDKERAYQTRYREMHPEVLLGKRLRRYGLTVAEYMQLLEQQGGACAICLRPETSKNWYGIPKLAVDHCHRTGKVRGLLCSKCNKGIGQLEDDLNRLRAAVAYLERAGSS